MIHSGKETTPKRLSDIIPRELKDDDVSFLYTQEQHEFWKAMLRPHLKGTEREKKVKDQISEESLDTFDPRT